LNLPHFFLLNLFVFVAHDAPFWWASDRRCSTHLLLLTHNDLASWLR